MSGQQQGQAGATVAQHVEGARSGAARRCYLLPQVLTALQMSRGAFYALQRKGQLPFVQEILPRAGRPRFRADLLDRYLEGTYGESRAFGAARRRA